MKYHNLDAVISVGYRVNSRSKQNQIYALQSGGGQSHVYARDIESLSISLPPLVEQKRIAGILSIAQREIDLFKNLVNFYRTQKRGLMQKLLTGTWGIHALHLGKGLDR